MLRNPKCPREGRGTWRWLCLPALLLSLGALGGRGLRVFSALKRSVKENKVEERGKRKVEETPPAGHAEGKTNLECYSPASQRAAAGKRMIAERMGLNIKQNSP